MTSLRIENLCLRARLELVETINAYSVYTHVDKEAHLNGYLMCHFLMTMTCLADSIRFDLLIGPLKDDLLEV